MSGAAAAGTELAGLLLGCTGAGLQGKLVAAEAGRTAGLAGPPGRIPLLAARASSCCCLKWFPLVEAGVEM